MNFSLFVVFSLLVPTLCQNSFFLRFFLWTQTHNKSRSCTGPFSPSVSTVGTIGAHITYQLSHQARIFASFVNSDETTKSEPKQRKTQTLLNKNKTSRTGRNESNKTHKTAVINDHSSLDWTKETGRRICTVTYVSIKAQLRRAGKIRLTTKTLVSRESHSRPKFLTWISRTSSGLRNPRRLPSPIRWSLSLKWCKLRNNAPMQRETEVGLHGLMVVWYTVHLCLFRFVPADFRTIWAFCAHYCPGLVKWTIGTHQEMPLTMTGRF